MQLRRERKRVCFSDGVSGEDNIPWSSPNNLGLSTAGQKKRRKRKPDTLL
jgi:hypothetical protein